MFKFSSSSANHINNADQVVMETVREAVHRIRNNRDDAFIALKCMSVVVYCAFALKLKTDLFEDHPMIAVIATVIFCVCNGAFVEEKGILFKIRVYGGFAMGVAITRYYGG